MIKLAFPGMIMIEAQFSVLEILTIAAGQFGTASLAAQSVLVTVTSTAFNIPFPLAIATSTRVANLIGAGLSDAARVTAKVVGCQEPEQSVSVSNRCRLLPLVASSALST